MLIPRELHQFWMRKPAPETLLNALGIAFQMVLIELSSFASFDYLKVVAQLQVEA